ncbi:hypothetical protein NA57DRAFT_61715 [Rhizodiscina lignyota]|uniref:CENP-V/GFA domain-containing protein n=1 Tax=Rhizodiscina lignyota TaxID=1504668 RepID=A0A9P4I6Y4_9PEZI|nr:hypothetical protein NA57DRAFT_61715 [Rhizodiscina lignyota]
MSTIASHFQCYCGSVREPGALLSSWNFPIESEFCHCNPCRQTTGVLGGTFVELKGQPSSLDACTRYARPGGCVDRYFCSTCGTRTFDHNTGSRKWFACSGIVEPSPAQDVVRVSIHAFVADTKDGGLSRPMRQLGGRKIPCYAEGVGQEMTDEDIDAMSRHNPESPEVDTLAASCHCGTVQFRILPPKHDNRLDLAPWLGAEGTKYLGLYCFCRYCRLGSGQSLSVNTYIMPENVIIGDKSPFDYTSYDKEAKVKSTALQDAIPGLRCYASSDDVRRSFCGKCGASIFWERESRPQVVNVAVGILRADSGCLASEWIQWDWKKIWWKEGAVDKEMVEALEKWDP